MIEEPARVFQDFASQEAMQALRMQLAMSAKSIDRAMRRFDGALVTARLDELNVLSRTLDFRALNHNQYVQIPTLTVSRRFVDACCCVSCSLPHETSICEW